MLEILGYGAVLLAVVIGVALLFAAKQPNTFSTARSERIAAAPERIYPLIADLRAMNTWNPFVSPDPAIRISYTGPEIGKGAAHTWAGNSKVGEGRIEVIDAVAPRKVAMRLEMIKPMKADNRVEFTLEPVGADTMVTWSMSGPRPMLGKVMTLFIDCDKMCGDQFVKGLAGLKAIAERQSVPAQ